MRDFWRRSLSCLFRYRMFCVRTWTVGTILYNNFKTQNFNSRKYVTRNLDGRSGVCVGNTIAISTHSSARAAVVWWSCWPTPHTGTLHSVKWSTVGTVALFGKTHPLCVVIVLFVATLQQVKIPRNSVRRRWRRPTQLTRQFQWQRRQRRCLCRERSGEMASPSPIRYTRVFVLVVHHNYHHT